MIKRGLIAGACGMMTLAMAATASAATYTKTLDGFTDDSVGSLAVTLAEVGGNIQVSLDASDPGDIFGFFFHIDESYSFADLDFNAGANPLITQICTGFNSIGGCGDSSNNLSGGGGNNPGLLDVGYQIGSSGSAGADNINTITFTISHDTEALTVLGFFDESMGDNTFAARLQSTGTGGQSAKLKGNGLECIADCGPPPQVPEPGVLSLFGIGLVGLLAARRRRSS